MAQRKKLFVIGGGGLGMQVAQDLEKHKVGKNLFDVFVFDKKKQLYNNISGLQACVEPDLVGGMLVPQQNALKNSKRVHAEVEAIYPVGYENRQKPSIKLKAKVAPVECDYLVIATGTSYTFPGKVPWWIGSSACTRLYEKIRDNIAKSGTIAIVGGGPVGCELTGAIKSAFPEKKVTLIHKGPSLCSSVRGADITATQGSQMTKMSGAEGGGRYCKPKTLSRIKQQLEKIGCEIFLNEQVVLDASSNTIDANTVVASVIAKSVTKAKALAASDSANAKGSDGSELLDAPPTDINVTEFVHTRGAPTVKPEEFMTENDGEGNTKKRTITTVAGRTFETDLVFFCTGPIANSSVYQDHYKLDYRGRLCVDDEMRAIPKDGETSNFIYAVGDCAGTRFDDEQNYTAGHEHVSACLNNLIAMATGSEKKMKPYKPAPHPALVLYMGRKAGIAEVNGMRFGKWLTHSLKSPEAIAAMVWKGSNAGKPPKSEWSQKKKSGCCGKKDAKINYQPGTVSGDDDW